jgi:hypothetical protein
VLSGDIETLNWILSPLGVVRLTDLSAQMIVPLYLCNQLIPRIKSNPSDGMTMGLTGNSTPLNLIMEPGHETLVFIFPPGDLTNMKLSIGLVAMLCFSTNCALMKVWVAPVSNKTVAG